MPNPNWHKGMPSANPNGRPPGPNSATVILKEAFLRAAARAGGGGDDGLDNYLTAVALSHPQVFVPALSKIIPLQVSLKGSGNITVNIVDRFDDDHPAPKVINGHAERSNGANGHAANGSGPDDPAAE